MNFYKKEQIVSDLYNPEKHDSIVVYCQNQTKQSTKFPNSFIYTISAIIGVKD